jgi:hypothetical protein
MKGQLWSAAQAKQSPKGRQALVTAVGTIYNTLNKPRVMQFDPIDVVRAMFDAVPAEDRANELKEATRTLRSLEIFDGGRKVPPPPPLALIHLTPSGFVQHYVACCCVLGL